VLAAGRGCAWLRSLIHNFFGFSPFFATPFGRGAQISIRNGRTNLVDAFRGDMWQRRGLAKIDLYLGIVRQALGQRAQALWSLDQARTSLEKLVSENEEVWEFRLILAEVYFKIGKIRHGQGQDADALANLEKCRDMCRCLLCDNPAVIQTQVILADSSQAISRMQQARGQRAAALESLQESKRIWDGLVHDHTDIAHFQSSLDEVVKEL